MYLDKELVLVSGWMFTLWNIDWSDDAMTGYWLGKPLKPINSESLKIIPTYFCWPY